MSLPPPAHIEALKAALPECLETHISWVFLAKHDVYKIKKPVRFPFLDFSTEQARLRACEAEIQLNRRLASDVYLGIVPLTMDENGTLSFGGRGTTVDYAVHMRRLPDDERADVMLRRGALRRSHVEALAARLVSFHQHAEIVREPTGPGSVPSLSDHIEENLAALGVALDRVLGDAAAQTLCEAQRRDLHALTPTLDQRRTRGRVVDGHGDLRLDHVYVANDGTIRVLDCVEFSRAFRVADVCADIAFFAMSLRQRGELALSESFVARYARDSGDHELYQLIDFFMTYWALVRAKVSEARAEQLDGPEARAQREVTAELLRLAYELSCNHPSRSVLIGVGGVIASGKSRLSERIATDLKAPVLQSDRLRKQLEGVHPEQKLEGKNAYSRSATQNLYRELEGRAEGILRSGRPVIVDASFREKAHRDALRLLAQRLGVPFLFVECHAPRHVLEQRLLARETKQGISDARIDLLEAFLASYEPLTAEELLHALRVDTSGDKDLTYPLVRTAIGSLAPALQTEDPL